MLKALYEVVSKAGSNMSETSRASLLSFIDGDANEVDGESARKRKYLESFQRLKARQTR